VLPTPSKNRINLRNKRIRIQYLANNLEAHDRLVYRRYDTCRPIESRPPDPGESRRKGLDPFPVARQPGWR